MVRSNVSTAASEHDSSWVSIVIPTRDRPLLLREAVGSALNADSTDVIVVDDAAVATDAVERLAEGFEQLVVLASGGIGPSGSRNAGTHAATTPWLMFLDDDDLVRPAGLAEVRRALASDHADVGLAFCNVAVQRPGRDEAELKPVVELGPLFHSVQGQYGAGGFCIRRDVFDLIGGYSPNLRYSENTDLIIRAINHCVSHGLSVLSVDTCLALIRLRPLSHRVLNDPLVLKESVEFLLVRHKDGLLRDPHAAANFHRIVGVNSARLRLPVEARHHIGRAIELDGRWKDRLRQALLRTPLVWRWVWRRSPRSDA